MGLTFKEENGFIFQGRNGLSSFAPYMSYVPLCLMCSYVPFVYPLPGSAPPEIARV
jgi:hypothetical protein